MLKKLKQIYYKYYYKWLTRGMIPEDEVYIVLRRHNEEIGPVHIESVHKTLKSAVSGRIRLINNTGDAECYQIERYGMWNPV